ncbi:MAG: hypothetical protein FJY76_02275 [Candidatus Aenigmarchaeota archaeon]|nr:hypothetical protein [Candidatus Aenigmarchaeota archaeon]
MTGVSNDAVIGTLVRLTGTPGVGITGFEVAVSGSDTSHDFLTSRNTFVDPVWGNLYTGIYVKTPPTTTCTDSDGGINYYTKGTARHGDVVSVDWCSTNTSAGAYAAQCSGPSCTLVEHYCRPPNEGSEGIQTQFYNCPYGCSDGACLQQAAPVCGDRVCANTNTTFTLYGGQSTNVSFGGAVYSVKLLGITSSLAGVVSVNGAAQSVSKGAPYTIAGLPIYVDDIFWLSTTDQTQNAARLVSGENYKTCPTDCAAPPVINCTDSDSGSNFYVKGTAQSTDINGRISNTSDYCSLLTTNPDGRFSYSQVSSCSGDNCYIIEQTCRSDGFNSNTAAICPGGCQDGRCLPTNIQVSGNCNKPNGKNYYVKSLTYYKDDFGGVGATIDQCCQYCNTAPNQTGQYLSEYYCENNAVGREIYTCPNSCSDGACLTTPPNQTQICENKCGNGVCNEFVCYGTGCPCVETAVTCPKDCGIQETCSDTDGGKDLLRKGMVSYWRPGYSQTFSDWCFSDYRYIMEYWCGKDVSPTGTGMTSMSFACPEGYICRDGACVQSAIPYGCPSTVYIAFDRNEYRFGDTVFVKVGVWDINYRGIPNARVWIEGKYNGVPIGLSTLTMDENGHYYTNSTVGSMQQGVYEYTATYNESGCPAISAGTKIMVYNTTAQKCKDSDGGIDYYTRGTTSECSAASATTTCRSFDDQCTSSKMVKEGFCKDDMLMDAEYACPNGCRDGACLRSGNVTQVGFRNAYWQCQDGKEANEGGETSCKPSETWQRYAEEFCKGRCTAATSIETKCRVGEKCVVPAGKCGVASFRVWNECDTGIATGECKESDSGKDAYVAGKAWMGNNVQEDTCSDKSVIEYYCSYDSEKNTEFIKKDEIPCPAGCSGGACINEKKNDCVANGFYCVDAGTGCGEAPALPAYTCGANEVCCRSKPPQYEERIKVKIDKGWNLISIPGTFSVDKGTCSRPEKWAFFWWYPPEKRFVSMKDVDKLPMDGWNFKKAGFWAYSPENCQMEFRISSGSEYYPVADLPQLFSGWNMVAITRDMLGSKPDDFRGDCEIRGIYMYDSGKWRSIREQVVPASLESLGRGMAVNVAGDCRLGFTSITPPAFPSGMMISV